MNVIEEMRVKYATNHSVLAKLDSILANLPATLKAAEEDFMQRAAKRAEIAKQKDEFIQTFFTENPLYYIPATGLFVLYQDHHYCPVSEDDVTHLIFQKIGANRCLSKWKYKIKLSMIKRIRETPMSEANPNTLTCKSVIRSFQTVFGNKAYAKYFLAVLGDILWGKKKLVYYVDDSFKPLLHLVARDFSAILNKGILDDFKHKYSSHAFSKCRLLPGKAPDRLPDLNGYDVIAVAAFYFRKYGSADSFLQMCPDTELRDKAMFLATRTPKMLVESFLESSTTVGEGMAFKSMAFLWKSYLKERQLPTPVSRLDFKHVLTEMGCYSESLDFCHGRVPLVQPGVLNFAHFWQAHMTPDTAGWFDHCEIMHLYNSWCESKHLRATLPEVRQWVEERLPGEKVRARCSLWNKEADLDNAMEAFRLEGNDGAMGYDFYSEYTKKHRKMVVTPVFFQLYYK